MEQEITIIGAAIIDVLVRPASAEVFESGSYASEEISMETGGDALNEATVLSRLGKKVHLQTVIGDDMAGHFVAAHCGREGIDISGSRICSDISTGINVVLVQENGERSFLTNPQGTLRKLAIEDIKMPFHEKSKILCFASIFVFPEIGTKELHHIFRTAKEQGLIVCADMTKCKNNEHVSDLALALKMVDYLFANATEAALVTGEEEPEKAAAALEAAGAENVIIKCGAKGCFVRSKKEGMTVPARANVRCIDTTGAGDSFVAGFLYALSEGRPLEECAVFANRCGAEAVTSLGACRWSQEADFIY